ncbi:HAD family hydrolase [Bacillus pseudomycoides]|uniref:HAD family hydrolase n=1 Tax=Bacillus pseudomycoides TaxID=64104 RepID=UPI000BEC83F3|nr:HAD family hydrolase [Bacillus pseudomycoides]PDZ70801.1 hypothetical protein CON58_26915 [Bacillus pseudomycoides]
MIKAYIFDQDGTLYPKDSKLYHQITNMTKIWLKNSLFLNDEELSILYDNLKKTYPHPFKGFESLGFSCCDYHKEVFNRINVKDFISRDKELSVMLELISQPKFIVTLSSPKFSCEVLNQLSVRHLFEDILFVSDSKDPYDKIILYEKIRKNLNLLPHEICIIGDNYDIDLSIAIRENYKCILVSKEEREDVINISNIYELSQVNLQLV